MKGIVLLNPAFSIGSFSKKESLLIQRVMMEKLMDELNVTLVSLNPHQTHEYYTIPHALLHDLHIKQPGKLDCLLLYSLKTMERFKYIYPEKWEELGIYFSRIVTVDELKIGSSEIGKRVNNNSGTHSNLLQLKQRWTF